MPPFCREFNSEVQPNKFKGIEYKIPKEIIHTSYKKKIMCLEVGWDLMKGENYGLFGYLLMVTRKSNSGEACRIIWLPCADCFNEYSWVCVILCDCDYNLCILAHNLHVRHSKHQAGLQL